nr:hypothetical protein [uncultured Draconibacterium sp.]
MSSSANVTIKNRTNQKIITDVTRDYWVKKDGDTIDGKVIPVGEEKTYKVTAKTGHEGELDINLVCASDVLGELKIKSIKDPQKSKNLVVTPLQNDIMMEAKGYRDSPGDKDLRRIDVVIDNKVSVTSGWDIVNAYQKDAVNKKLMALYNGNKLPHEIKGVNLGFPEITGGTIGKQEVLQLKIHMDGTINQIVKVDGDCRLTVNLDAIKGSIENSGDTSNTFSIDVSGDILSNVDLSELKVTAIGKEIPTKKLEKIVLELVNKAFQNVKPIIIPFNFGLHLSLDESTIRFAFVENSEDPSLSFFTILVGLQGHVGTYMLSTNVIYNSSDNNSSIVLSNWLIMDYLKQNLYQVLNNSDLFVEDAFLELENGTFPILLTNNSDSVKTKYDCGASVKIDKGGIKCLFESDSQLKIEFDLRYTEIIIGTWHTYHIKLYVSFTQSEGKLKLNFSKKIDSCSGGTTCKYIKKAVKEALEDFEGLFTNGLQLSIPNMHVNKVASPNYLQISGKSKSPNI